MQFVVEAAFFCMNYFFAALQGLVLSAVTLLTKKHFELSCFVYPLFFAIRLTNASFFLQLRGLKNMRKIGIFCAGHYSTMETLFVSTFKKKSFVIIRKGLVISFLTFTAKNKLSVPKTGINRLTRKQAEKMLHAFRKIRHENYTLCLFPQGTRCDVRTKNPPLHDGVYGMCQRSKVFCYPMNSNSGLRYKRSGLLRNNTMPWCFEFYDPIKKGLDKKDFMHTLAKKIEESRCWMIQEYG